MRSLAVEGTVFLLIVSGVVELTVSSSSSPFLAAAILVGLLNLALAYLCWTRRRFGFLAAILVSLVVAIGAFPYPLHSIAGETPYGALVDSMVILPALLTVFFAWRAYRETASSHPFA